MSPMRRLRQPSASRRTARRRRSRLRLRKTYGCRCRIVRRGLLPGRARAAVGPCRKRGFESGHRRHAGCRQAGGAGLPCTRRAEERHRAEWRSDRQGPQGDRFHQPGGRRGRPDRCRALPARRRLDRAGRGRSRSRASSNPMSFRTACLSPARTRRRASLQPKSCWKRSKRARLRRVLKKGGRG